MLSDQPQRNEAAESNHTGSSILPKGKIAPAIVLVLSIGAAACGKVLIEGKGDSRGGGSTEGGSITTGTSGASGEGGYGGSNTGGQGGSEKCIEQEILSPEPESPTFGHIVAYDREQKLLVTSQIEAFPSSQNPSKVFLFRRTQEGFQHFQTISFPDEIGDIAVNGDFLVFASQKDYVSGITIYQNKNGTFIYHSDFYDPSNSNVSTKGVSVDLEGIHLVYGSPVASSGGKAYEFFYNSETDIWESGNIFTSPDNIDTSKAFGSKVAVEGTTTLIADHYLDKDMFDNNGAVHVYENIVLKQTLYPDLPDTGNGIIAMGDSLSFNGNTLVIGSPHENGIETKGAAYVLTKNPDGTFTSQTKLFGNVNNDQLGYPGFGYKVAINSQNNIIVVNDPSFDATHFFTLENNAWVNKDTIPSPNTFSLLIDDEMIIRGTWNDKTQGVIKINCLQ